MSDISEPRPLSGPSPSASAAHSVPTTIIEPRRSLWSLDLDEVWDNRGLLFSLIWRDIKVRYKQTTLGWLWLFLIPMIQVLIYGTLFGGWLRISTGTSAPYLVFVSLGLLPWQAFARSLSEGSGALANNQTLMEKVYIPRLLLPITGIMGGGADLGIVTILISAILLGFGIMPPAEIVYVPLFLLMMLTAAFGLSLWTSVLYVMVRDLRHVLPFVIQFMFFATPIIYPIEAVPERWRMLLSLNPMAAVITGLRWCLLPDQPAPDPAMIMVGVVVTIMLIVTGLAFFRWVERFVVDQL